MISSSVRAVNEAINRGRMMRKGKKRKKREKKEANPKIRGVR